MLVKIPTYMYIYIYIQRERERESDYNLLMFFKKKFPVLLDLIHVQIYATTTEIRTQNSSITPQISLYCFFVVKNSPHLKSLTTTNPSSSVPIIPGCHVIKLYIVLSYPFKNIWGIYMSGQLSVMLLQTFMYRILCQHRFLILLSK